MKIQIERIGNRENNIVLLFNSTEAKSVASKLKALGLKASSTNQGAGIGIHYEVFKDKHGELINVASEYVEDVALIDELNAPVVINGAGGEYVYNIFPFRVIPASGKVSVPFFFNGVSNETVEELEERLERTENSAQAIVSLVKAYRAIAKGVFKIRSIETSIVPKRN